MVCLSFSRKENVLQTFFVLQYLDRIIEDLTPDDIRQLITAEDELSQCENFVRIFPSRNSNTYFPYFESQRYYNMLFDAWEFKYHDRRTEGIQRLKNLCAEKIHLQVPSVCRKTVSEILFDQLFFSHDN